MHLLEIRGQRNVPSSISRARRQMQTPMLWLRKMKPLKIQTMRVRDKLCAWGSIRVKVVLVAVLVAMALIAAGVVLVTQESKRAQDEMLAQFAMSSLALGISRVGRRPSPEALLVGTPDSLYKDWLDLAPGGGALSFRMYYAGYSILSYTHPAAEAKYPRLQQPKAAVQASFLNPQPPFPPSGRTNAVYSMRTGRMVLQDVSPALAPTVLLALTVPAFAPATSAAETWGWADNMTATECLTGALPCYNATTGQKWWGQIAVLLGRNEFGNLSAVQKLSSSGYGYRVSIMEDAPGLEAPAALSPTVLHTNLDQVSCDSPSVIATDTLAPGLEVTIEICVVEGYTVTWFIPTLVAVAVVSVGLVVLIAFSVVTWMRHSELVRALLPDSAIQHLTRTLHPRKLSEEVSSGSPAEKLISMLGLILSGKTPPVQDAIQVMAALKERADLYVPVNLEKHVRLAAGMDAEVVDALMAALVDARRTMDGQAARHLSGGHALHLSSLGNAQERLEEEGYGDLNDAMMSITGLRKAAGPPPAAEEATLITTDFFLLDTVGVSKHPLGQSTFHSLAFSEVEQEDIICNGVLDSTGFLAHNFPRPQPSIILELEAVLMGANSLKGDFNAFRLNEVSQGHPLSALGYWCFHQAGILQELGLPGKQLAGFLRTLESGYRDNPYHNKTHAAHVLQGMHAFLHTGGLRGKYADSFTTAACYLAAAMHDYDHRGVTNDYLIITKNELAQRYNDRSPHENHHVSAGFALLNTDENNFLSHLPPADWMRMRRIVIELILGTDHFAINGCFTSVHRLATAERVQRIIEGRVSGPMSSSRMPALSRHTATGNGAKSTSSELSKNSNARPSVPTGQTPVIHSTPANVVVGPLSGIRFKRQTTDGTSPAPTRLVPQTEILPLARATAQASDVPGVVDATCITNSTNLSGPAPIDEAERLMSLQMMLKCADLGHTCTALSVHLNWVKCLETEMFQQGDREREQGLPISPLCDRSNVGVTKSQVGFFEVVVLPLLTNFTSRFPTTQPALLSAVANYHYWQAQAAGGRSSAFGN